MALAALVVFNFIQNNFVRLYCDSCHTSVQLKKPSKLVNFCVAILILNMEENTLYYFKKGKNAIETHKGFVQCMEMVLWLIESVKSGLWNFVLEISRWTMVHSG